MGAYLVRRIAQFIPVLFIGSLGVWAMAFALPGDPSTILGGENATPAQIAAINARLGLDKPPWEQFWIWISHAVQGDLGTSFISGRTVTSLLLDRIPATVQLAVVAIVLVMALALPLGMVVALKPGSWIARIVRTFLAGSLAMPGFWLGMLLILVFSVHFGLLPSASSYVPVWSDPIAMAKSTLLPALAIALHASSVTARFVAASLSEAMESDYVRTARAKGAPERIVVVRHALRNAMLPTVTVLGLQLGALLGGAIVVEVVFTYPGLGRLIFTAISSRDYALVQGAVLFVMCVFLFVNLLIDVIYAYLDPRIRLQ